MSGIARKVMDEQVAENDLLMAALDLLHKYGYLCHHDFDSRRTYPDNGFPDILAVHEQSGYILTIETKTMKGKLSGAQKRWRAAISRGPCGYLLLRPDDWSNGRLERWLAASIEVYQRLVIHPSSKGAEL